MRGIEAAERVEHDVASLVPGEAAVVIARERRVAVPVVERLAAEPAGLQPVVAMRQLIVGVADGGDQSIDDGVINLVGEIAVGDRVRILPPLVVDLLVLRQRIDDQREHTGARAEPVAQCLRRRPPRRRVRIVQAVECIGERQALAVDVEAQLGDGLVEQPAPGPGAGNALVVQDRLDLVGELMRLVLANVGEPGRIAGHHRVAPLGVQHLVGELVELEGEEQCLGGDNVVTFLQRLQEAAAGRIRHVGGEIELGKAHGFVQPLEQRLVTADGVAEAQAGDRRQLSLELGAEGAGLVQRLLQVPVKLDGVRPIVKIGQIPDRRLRLFPRVGRCCGRDIVHCVPHFISQRI